MFDFLIIGGGIAGLSSAAALAPHGPVCVVERERSLGYHASGRAAGIFVEDYGNDAVCALNSASLPVLHEMDVLKPRAMMMVAKAGDAEAFEAEFPTLGLSRIPIEQARLSCEILAPDVTLAAARRDAFDLDTDGCMAHFRKAALAGGAEIKTGADVLSLSRAEGVWRAETGQESIAARRVVNAAGPWADELANLAGARAIGIKPKRRSMAVLPWPDGKPRLDWPFIDGVGESWYMKPDPAGMIVSPSDTQEVAPCDAWPDDMVIAEGIARFQEMVTLDVTRVTRTWAGLRSFVDDGALVIGADPAVDGFFWCAAQGGYGFQVAPAAAALLAHHMVATPSPVSPEIKAALSPDRFVI